MDTATNRAVYKNLWILALADGKLAEAEKAYLDKVANTLQIDPVDAASVQNAVQSGDTTFVPIGGDENADAALAVIARMVRVDNDFDAKEQEAFIALGKAFGIAPDELGPVLRKVWNEDPDALLNALVPAAPPEPEPGGKSIPATMVTDGLEDKEALLRSAPHADWTFVSLSDLLATASPPNVILFHVVDDRVRSEQTLKQLLERFPSSFVAFIARRDQAPQIGHLLGRGASRCFVEPLYPGEIEKALKSK